MKMDSESRTGLSNQGDPGKIRNYADLRNVKPGLQCTARGFPVLSTMWLLVVNQPGITFVDECGGYTDGS